MGAAESDLPDGSVSSATDPNNPSTAGSHSGATRTTRTHLVYLSRAHNKFSIQLFQEFAKDGKRPGNFVICPVGMSLGLGMVYLGARGSTQDELHKLLHLQEVQKSQLLPAYAAMHWDITRSTQPRGCIFEIAIRVFAQSGHPVAPPYESICRRYDIARLRSADFRNRPDLARKEINQWTEERTHGRIRDVIPMGIVDRETSVLLLCAVYARLQFLRPFDKRKTTACPFYLTAEAPQVPMMYQRCRLRTSHQPKLDSDVLELPLANGHSKLYVVLPKKPDGVGRVEMKISRSSFELVLDKLQDDLVDVYLPKFRYELGIICLETLARLGVRNLSTAGKADLSGLDGTNNLTLTRFFHHVCFEIDEGIAESTPSGTGSGIGCGQSGSNSTPGVGVASTSSSSAANNNTSGSINDNVQQVPKVFRVDHPFLFFVYDDRTGAILFIGRVVRPHQLSGVAAVT